MVKRAHVAGEPPPLLDRPSWLRFLMAMVLGHVLASAAVGLAITTLFCMAYAIGGSFDGWKSLLLMLPAVIFLANFATELTAVIIIPVSLALLPFLAAAALFLNTSRLQTYLIGAITGCSVGWGILVAWRGSQDGLATLPVNFLFGIVAGIAYAAPIWALCIQPRLKKVAAQEKG